MADTSFDVAVVGGGLVGLTTAIIAARRRLRVINLAPAGMRDARTSALMGPAIDFLNQHALVPNLAQIGTRLSEIRIIDATTRFMRAPEAYFQAGEIGLEAFGWNIPNAALLSEMSAIAETLPNLVMRDATLANAAREGDGWTLTLADGARYQAALLAGADGKGSRVREILAIPVQRHDYAQAALVCDLVIERPIGGCSVEFHYPEGPFTLVPDGGHRANLVWLDRRDVLDAVRMDSAGFAARITGKAMGLFGALTPVTAPVVFPLSRLSVPVAGRNGAVLLGEAAHAFPPIGAQGLNLGLRDVAALDDALAETPAGARWADETARLYASRQTQDMRQTGLFVSTLFDTLVGRGPLSQLARVAGLHALNTIPGLRRAAFAFGMGRR